MQSKENYVTEDYLNKLTKENLLTIQPYFYTRLLHFYVFWTSAPWGTFLIKHQWSSIFCSSASFMYYHQTKIMHKKYHLVSNAFLEKFNRFSRIKTVCRHLFVWRQELSLRISFALSFGARVSYQDTASFSASVIFPFDHSHRRCRNFSIHTDFKH